MSILELLAQAPAILTTVYWIAGVVGGGMLLISTLAGGDADVDVDADFDLDVDVDTDHTVPSNGNAGHHHEGSLATWFSTQFIVFFLAMFGSVGVVLTYFTAMPWPATLALAVGGGIIIGQGAHQVMRVIRKTSGNSTPDEKDYVNKLARVTIHVPQGAVGQVMMRVGRTDRYVTARARHESDTFAVGESVGVVTYQNGVAEIVSRKEIEFLNETATSHSNQKEGS